MVVLLSSCGRQKFTCLDIGGLDKAHYPTATPRGEASPLWEADFRLTSYVATLLFLKYTLCQYQLLQGHLDTVNTTLLRTRIYGLLKYHYVPLVASEVWNAKMFSSPCIQSSRFLHMITHLSIYQPIL
jgi:hypothetical protein